MNFSPVMSRRSLLGLLSAGLLPPLSARAQGPSSGPQPTLIDPLQAPPGPQDIVLGQSASFSGAFSSQAHSYRAGAVAYFDHVNQQGGVGGRRIHLRSLDDSYAVDRAKAHAAALLADPRVVSLFGFMWTNTVRACVPLAEAAGTTMFAPYTGYEDLYRQPSPWVFTTRASFAQELQAILKHLHTVSLQRIGLLHYDSPSGLELLADTQQRMAALGMRLTATASMKVNDKSVAAAVNALSGEPLQALILGASGSDAVSFIRAYEPARAGRTRIYARSLVGTAQLIDELGPLARGISVSQTAPNPLRQRQVAVEYRQLLARRFPQATPDFIGLEGMLAAKTMVLALQRARGELNRPALRGAIESLGTVDLGGYALQFGPGRRHGSQFVDITMIDRDGRFVG
jgi:ABC-type branched-subunit amino acid transport system substrate-binding protein